MEESPTKMSNNNVPKIPVFTVIKNNAILKNIFVVNNSAVLAGTGNGSVAVNDQQQQHQVEETLLVGRHPDCSIALTHPSISRFHLRIHTVTSSQKLAVTDLSSVHGTSVSGVKIQAETRVELKEGDTIQLGGSSRIYRLQWVPLSQAYDFRTPFVSGLDVKMTEEKENIMSESKQVLIDSPKVEDNGNELAEANYSVCTGERDIDSIDTVSDVMDTLFLNENSGVYVKKEIPSAPPLPEGVTYMFREEGRARSSSRGNTGTKLISATVEEFILENKTQQFNKDAWSLQAYSCGERLSEGENHIFEAISSPVGEQDERTFGDNREELVVDGPRCGSSHTKSMNLSSGADSVISKNVGQLFMRDEHDLGLHDDAGIESLHCTESAKFSSPVEVVSSETGSHQSVSYYKQSLKPNSVTNALFKGEGSQDGLGLQEDAGIESLHCTKSVKFSSPVEMVSSMTGSHESVSYRQSPKPHSVTTALFKGERSPDVNLNLVLNLGSLRFAEVAESYAETEPSNDRRNQSNMKAMHNASEFYNKSAGEIVDSNKNLYDEGNQTAGNMFARQSINEGKDTDYYYKRTERKSGLLMSLDSVLADEVFPSAVKPGVRDMYSTWSIDSIHCDYSKALHAPLLAESMKLSSSIGEDFVKAEDEQFINENKTPQSHYSGGLVERQALDSPSVRSQKKKTPQSPYSSGLSERQTLEGPPVRSQKKKTLQSHNSSGLTEGKTLEGPSVRSQKKKTPQSHNSSGLTERQTLEGPSVRSQKNSSFSSAQLRSGKPAGALQMKEEKSQGRSLRVSNATKNKMKMKENTKFKRKKEFSSGSNWEEVLTPGKENRDPQYSSSSRLTQRLAIESPTVGSEKVPSMSSIWSRRGKPAGILDVKTEYNQVKSLRAGTDAKDEVKWQDNVEDKTILKEFSSDIDGYKGERFTPDKENLIPDTSMFKSMTKMDKLGNIEKTDQMKAISKGQFDTNGEEGEMFTPCKENLNPTALMLRSMKKKGELGSIENSKPLKTTTSEVNVSLDFHPSRDLFASPDKENQTLEKVLQEQESAKTNTNNKFAMEIENFVVNRRAERVPFQSLPANSALFIPSAATQSCTSINLSQDNPKKGDPVKICKLTRWTMFVDTASLLDKESRNALELLQGIKGTLLLIPRIVIRELESLRQHESLFRRTAEASQVLQWIEDSIVTTNWWIQVQSSEDEARLIASTPPASPQSLMCPQIPPLGSLFSAGHNFTEIVSPTAEDHVLDCALRYNGKNNDVKTILISNDVNVKIKAMAEGLLCETAKEFRESLVNPFSGRFMWTDSSPRGLTWNCFDDVVLKEKYYPSPKTKLLKREAKGLKLILLHNAHYGRI